MKALLSLACACGFVFGTGCGMSPEDSRKLWRHVDGALGKSQGQALTADVDLDADCSDGGTVSFNGSLDTPDDATSGSTFEYEVTFNACAGDDETLNGNLKYSSTLDTTSAGLSFVFHYQGHIDGSGEENGACDVDMDGSLSSSITGDGSSFGNVDVEYEYDGTICGNDADETFSASTSD